jgi:iron complex outermembrane recepter protein
MRSTICGPRRLAAAALPLLWLVASKAGLAEAQQATPFDALSGMSLEELSNVQVTSVSKSAEPLSQAAAAIYVISHDQIVRSGATSIPEALRLAPNLLITQLSASNYVIEARGLGGNPGDQNFANKVLLLIDGRSVYSPLYSGIYVDAQEVMLQDIDRIEVISGPGATLWGANAVNGVINIVTRSAQRTQGGLVDAGAGNLEQKVSARYGAALDDTTAIRVYGTAFRQGAEQLAAGVSAEDAWRKVQGGFRLDRNLLRDSVTVQGDVYRASEDQLDQYAGLVSGANVLTRWDHRGDQSDLQVQAYYDQTERFSPVGSGAFVLNTYDLEVQQSINAGAAQKIVWGAGERVNVYGITNTSTFLFEPSNRALSLGDLFAQDTITLAAPVKLTAGLKAEDDPYSGWALLPDLRLSYQPNAATLIWAAGSRAIRSPTPFDDDVVEKLGTRVYLVGNPQFQSEKLSAYEVGWRAQAGPTLSLSITGFYNVYDDLRTIELASSTQVLPLHWGNLMAGDTYGVGAWAQWQVTDIWRLSPGVVALHEHFHFSPGASGLLGVAQAGDDPSSHATLSSSLDLPRNLTLDATLRYVGALPNPALPSFVELDARCGWHVSRSLDLSVGGTNLLHAHHLEYATPAGELIARRIMAQGQWRF